MILLQSLSIMVGLFLLLLASHYALCLLPGYRKR